MNSAKAVNTFVSEWINKGLSKAEIVVKTAEAELDWCYVLGASGQECIPSKREAYANRSVCPSGESDLIRKNCQVLRDSNPCSSCSGCKWYPNGERTLMDDCQGFVKQICKRVGIVLSGAGASTMWRSDTNWSAKGKIDTIPEQVCCVFWQNKTNPSVMDHVGFYIGNGMMIHCSGKVKKEALSKKCTHWAIPKGLEGGVIPVPTDKPTLRKGSKGEYVTLLQTKLIQRGYDLEPYGADGSFGNKTFTAVKAFQKNSNLNADGIVGPKTWAALDSGEETLYTVTIQHVSFSVADEIVKKYGGTMKGENVNV